MSVIERPDDVRVETQERGKVRGDFVTIIHHELLTYSSSFEIVEGEDEWTVTDRETGIFGTGPDEDSALRDYLAALVEHRDVLARQPALSEDLERQLKYLRRVIG